MEKLFLFSKFHLAYVLVLFFVFQFSNIQGQNLYVRLHDGQQQSYQIQDLAKLSFENEQLILTEKTSSVHTVLIADIRYLNFINLLTGSLTISEPLLNSISLFPNPVSHSLSVQYTAVDLGRVQIDIVSMAGCIVATRDVDMEPGINHIAFNVSDLPDGVYACILQTEKNIQKKKFIKY